MIDLVMVMVMVMVIRMMMMMVNGCVDDQIGADDNKTSTLNK